MQFNFYLSAEKELQYIYSMFCQADPMGLEARAEQYGFPLDLARRISQNDPDEWENDVIELLNQEYANLEDELNQSVEFHQEFWVEQEGVFSEVINEILDIEVPDYNVLLTRYITGISDWHGTDIVLGAFLYEAEPENQHSYVLLFETILSQVFMKIRELYNQEYISDWNVWAISELATYAILRHSFDGFENFDKIGYAQIEGLKDKVCAWYVNSESFQDFLLKIVKYFKENPLSVD